MASWCDDSPRTARQGARQPRRAPLVAHWPLLASLLLVLAVLACAQRAAAASPYATSCDPSDINYNLCTVDAERLETIAATVQTVQAQQSDDQSRLDLAWWGAWFAGGLILVRIVQPYWDRLFSWGKAPQ